MNFNNILIGSENPDALVDYYTKMFGEPAMSDGGYTGWQIGSGFMSVGPHSEVTGKNVHPGRLLWNIDDKRRGGATQSFGALHILERRRLAFQRDNAAAR